MYFAKVPIKSLFVVQFKKSKVLQKAWKLLESESVIKKLESGLLTMSIHRTPCQTIPIFPPPPLKNNIGSANLIGFWATTRGIISKHITLLHICIKMMR